MLETQIKVLEKVKLKNPTCFIGLPGIGHIGRIAVEYLVHETKAKKFAELYSPYFFPFIIVHENRIHTLRNEFYWTRQKGKDYIFLIGDVQTYDPKGHYEVAGKILDLLKGLGCKKVITIGGFSTGNVSEKPKVFAVLNNKEQEAEFFSVPVDPLYAGPLFRSYVRGHYDIANLMVGAPDEGGVKRARAFAEQLGGYPVAIVYKERPEPNKSEVTHVAGKVKGRRILFIDDMGDTFGTLYNAAQAVVDRGAQQVDVFCTHCVLSPLGRKRLQNMQRRQHPPLQRIFTTDTIHHTRLPQGIIRISVARLLAEAISRRHSNESISELYNEEFPFQDGDLL